MWIRAISSGGISFKLTIVAVGSIPSVQLILLHFFCFLSIGWRFIVHIVSSMFYTVVDLN